MGRCKRCQGRGTLVGFKPELDVPDGLRQIAPDFPKQKKPRAKWGAGLRKETVVLPWGATTPQRNP